MRTVLGVVETTVCVTLDGLTRHADREPVRYPCLRGTGYSERMCSRVCRGLIPRQAMADLNASGVRVGHRVFA
jgi:hypothetical protein